MHKKEIIQSLEDALQTAKYGCLDHNCVLSEDSYGQHTNGGCICVFTLRKKLVSLMNRLDTEKVDTENPDKETPVNDWF